jgi:hypothetical protein
LQAKSNLHITYSLEANIILLSNSKIPFQNGYFDASDSSRARTQNAWWFTAISQPHSWRSLKRYIRNVTNRGITVKIDTWDGREFDGKTI